MNKLVSKKSYGRGKYTPSQDYLEYIEFIADSPIYSGLEGIKEEDGKINWQCSSGKTTSFYKYFESRKNWWIDKADELKIPGEGQSNDRLVVAARQIHPLQEKVCLICGKYRFVGYMYTNHTLTGRLNKLSQSKSFKKQTPVADAIEELINIVGFEKTREFILDNFPEKVADIELFDNHEIQEFFEKTQHIRTSLLSPGYMGDCPHRLDGLHDYCTYCRKSSDPGRSDENMRTYNHDRRAFLWWSEGDWKLADTLYNSSSAGVCSICNLSVDRVSPDHIGPLSCGFQQNGLFEALCSHCNSTKNRRFTFENVNSLIKYEKAQDSSVASWQVRSLWDNSKINVSNDIDAKHLSNYMRAMQDYYLRTLDYVQKKGYTGFLSQYLSPEFAHYEITFNDLNTSTFEFTSINKVLKKNNGSRSLAARSVRIAFDELNMYCIKKTDQRKSILLEYTDQFLKEDTPKLDSLFDSTKINELDKNLNIIFNSPISIQEKDKKLQVLVDSRLFKCRSSYYTDLKIKFEEIINQRGIQLSKLFFEELSK